MDFSISFYYRLNPDEVALQVDDRTMRLRDLQHAQTTAWEETTKYPHFCSVLVQDPQDNMIYITENGADWRKITPGPVNKP